MKTTIKIITITFGLAWALLNTACVEYSQPLCDPSNRVDIGIEGEKTLVLYRDFDAMKQTFDIKRIGKGTYAEATDINSPFYVCQTPKGIYGEFKSESGNYVGFRIDLKADGGMTFSNHFVSRSDLDKAGIPYQIESRSTTNSFNLQNKLVSELSADYISAGDQQEVLVVKNNKADKPYLLKNGQAMSLGINFFK